MASNFTSQSRFVRMIYRVLRTRRNRTWYQVIAWWELRRFLYNGIVFVAGMVSVVVILSAITATDESGEADFTPFLAIFFAAIVANFCYTFGWVVELAARGIGYRRRTLGPELFAVGTLFSILVVSLPAVLWILIWIVTVFRSLAIF